MSLTPESTPATAPVAAPARSPLRGLRASAGSGKTYSLTTRYLEALRTGATPQRILATTFTRKAAGEILGRVLKRLAEEAETDRRARDDLARLCHSLHQVSICTLDSFFSRLAQCFRHELDLPPEARLVDERSAEAATLRLEAVRAVLAEAETPSEREAMLRLLEQLQAGMAPRSVAAALDALLGELYDTYRETAPEAWDRLEVPEPLEETQLAHLLEALQAQADAATNGNWRKGFLANHGSAKVEDWAGFLAKGLAKPLHEGTGLFYKAPIPEEVEALYAPLISHARSQLLAPLRERALALRELLRRFDAHYERARRRRRMLLFGDVPFALQRVLPDRSPAEVGYRLDSRIEHLLLDEFQDTSPTQWAVLSPFARQIADAAELHKPASFFCVGDTKQSIYGWRGACPELFGQVQVTVRSLKWETTAKSYRSSQIVLDTVNQLFSRLTGNAALSNYPGVAAQWQADFAEHQAEKQLPGYVELVTSPAAVSHFDGDGAQDGGTAEEAAETQGHLQCAVQRVKQLAEAAPGCTIGVLFRSNAQLGEFLYLLEQEGVPASGEGGGALDDDPAVETVLAALTLADFPGHTAAAFQVASSPLGPIVGLTLSPDAARPPARKEILRVSREIRRRLLEDGLPEVLTDWGRRLAPSCEARGAQRLAQLVSVAEGAAGVPSLRPMEFVDQVRSTRVEEPSPARVRVMTIHGAKGLEFDLVVLPELSGRIDPAYRRPPVLLERETPTGPIRAVYPYAPKAVRALSSAMQQAWERHAAEELRESLSLLYVAMTRAVHALHLVIPPLRDNGQGAPKPETLSAASLLRQALRMPGCEETFAGGQTLYTHGAPEWYRGRQAKATPAIPPRDRPEVHFAKAGAERRHWPEVKPSELAHGGVVRASSLLTLEEPAGMRFGSLIHAWFAGLEWSDSPLRSDEELLALGRRTIPGQPDAWYVEALARWREMLARPAVQAVLARPETAAGAELELWREKGFAVRVDDHLVNGTFDRVVLLRERGQVARAWLLDYKTDRSAPANRAALVERYRPQLEQYGAGLCSMLALPREVVELRLLFVSDGWEATL